MEQKRGGRERRDALPELLSERLKIRCALPSEASRVVAYYQMNRAHLAPWEPRRPPSFYRDGFWERELRESLRAYHERRALRLVLEARGDIDGSPELDPTSILGVVRYSNIQLGVCQSCTLGYSLAREAQGRGLMFEALRVANEFCFEQLGLHRIEANYLPRNGRSNRLLERLGFREEGIARGLLEIAGRWEDHVRTALLRDDLRL